jgi:RNA polymerase sigma factor (sigma-70 family)
MSTENEPNSGIDLVELYRRDVSQYPILSENTQKEYAVLARRFILAKKAHKSQPDLNLEDISEEEKAFRALWSHNQRLVISWASRYQDKGVPFLDLIQAGNLGLGNALERFDPERGFRVSTYVSWSIRKEIQEEVAKQGRGVALTRAILRKVSNLLSVWEVFNQEFKRSPSIEELAERAGIKAERARYLLGLAQKTLSLDSPIAKSVNTKGQDILEKIGNSEVSLSLREVFNNLTEADKKLLLAKFGSRDNKNLSDDQLAALFSKSKSEIKAALERIYEFFRSDLSLIA